MSTREKILDSALALFNEQGTASVSTNHIAAKIGISPGNLYYYFENKEDIIQALFERLFAAWDRTFQLPSSRSPGLEDLEAMIAGNYHVIWEYRFAYREMAALLRSNPELHARYLEVRQSGYEGFKQLFAAFVEAGILKEIETQEEMAALTELTWIVSELWPVNLELSGRDLDQTGIESGIAIMRHLFRPYLARDLKQG